MAAGEKAAIRRRAVEVIAEQWGPAPAARLKLERVRPVQRLVLQEVLHPGATAVAGRTARRAVLVRGAEVPLQRVLHGDHQNLKRVESTGAGYRDPAVRDPLAGLPRGIAAAARRTLSSWAAASPGGKWPTVEASFEQEAVARCRAAGSGQTFWVAVDSGQLLTYSNRFTGAGRVIRAVALFGVTFGACPAGIVVARLGAEAGLWDAQTEFLVGLGGFFTSVCLVLVAVAGGGGMKGPIGGMGPPR